MGAQLRSSTAGRWDITERSAEIIAEFVRLKVDVIVTPSAKDAIAAKQATSLIPIVFIVGDPVGFGLVASLARPGGNVTGLSTQAVDLSAKRIELLREVTPGLSQMAVMLNPENPRTRQQMAEIQTAASALGVGIVPLEIRRTADIAPALDAAAGRVQALRVVGDRITFDEHALINRLALAALLPTMHSFRLPVESGGLMSYGPSFRDMTRQVADYVDKILRGTRPADLAVQQPTKFELVINLKTAKALGLDIQPRLRVLADELIE